MNSNVSTLSSQERDRIIEEHLPLVRYVVRKMHVANAPVGLEFDDLVGHGTLGLIQAVDRFDGSQGVQFSSFAITRIRGAVLDALRALDPVGRPTRTLAKRLDATYNTLALELGREPSACEVQQAAGVAAPEYWRARAATSLTVVPIEHPSDSEHSWEDRRAALPVGSDRAARGRRRPTRTVAHRHPGRHGLHRMLDVVLERGHHSFECVHLRKDRTTFPALVVGSAVGGTDGSPRYRHISIQDISSLKETQAQLHAARVEAQRANQAKSEFLSRMSHELRTPLNVILGFAQVLQLDELSPGQSESVGHILQAGRHLLALIDDVLDISRIESGKMALSIEPVAMGDAVEDVLKLMQPLADERGVTLTHPSRGCGCHAFADRQRLKQVLLNLVTNAIKYNTRGGSLVIECADDGARVHISVIDDGIGFPEDALGRLFVPFDRLGREATEVEGTGLGLSLCKGLVEAMGGTIDARARPGGGSIFTVQLNRADAPALTGHVDGGHAAAGRASRGVVLYVEDNLANFKLIEQVLSRRPGISVIPAMQGSLGLQLARDHHPDLVLLDLHLPDMKGDEVLQRLLRDPMTASIPVVIASADATQRQVERLLRMGARAYLTKPIDVPRLLETVDELLGD